MTKLIKRPSLEGKVYGNIERRLRAVEIRGGGGGGGGGNLEAFWWGNTAPLAVGQNGGIWTVPFVNGASVTFTLSRAYFRFESASTSGTYQITIQKSPAGSAFISSDLATLSLAAGVNEASTAVVGTVISGQLLRVFWNTLGSNAAVFTIQLEGTQ